MADCSTAKVGGGGHGEPGSGDTATSTVPFTEPQNRRGWRGPREIIGSNPFALQSAVGAVHQTLRIAQALRRCQELVARGLHWVM